jgi:UDP-glucose 4-epimerase
VKIGKIKVGITGASGVLGSILVDKLNSDNGFTLSCFDKDITSRSEVVSWVLDNEFDVILHFAAIVAVEEAVNNALLAYDVNVGGTINLMSAISRMKSKVWLFYASTCHVYKSQDYPIDENCEVDPISLYGLTKYMGEKICCDVADVDANLSVCVGRIFSSYHKNQRRPSLYPSIIHRLETENLDQDFFLSGANKVRDFLSANEVVDIIIKLIKKKPTGIINIASGFGVKIKDFVQSLTNKKLKVITDSKVDSLVADVSKLKSVLNNTKL